VVDSCFGKTDHIKKITRGAMMKKFKTVTTQELTTVVCDGCGLQASANGDYEFHEFISVEHHCGYGSVHGDGKHIGIDLCQQCFADMCGDTLRVTDKNITEDNESSETSQLEYSNIFDVICQSKTEADQLKKSADLRLAVRDILLKNKVADNNELMAALKRVEQLWDAQYQSAEGNELHQLADLICAYEKKDWNSFFEQAPLADDDFMPGRLNFESKFTFDEEVPENMQLSRLVSNTNIDDVKKTLIESIIRAVAKYPELRLGQLLEGAMNITPSSPEISHVECPELFYVKDDLLAEKINLFCL
jgi:hypothetical protein